MDTTKLRQLGVQADELIRQQAEALIQRSCAERLAALTTALAALGITARPTVRFVEVWEDCAWGQLPPKLVAELTVAGSEGTLKTRLDVPVGAFHDPGKAEQIFELCMLRAEAQQDLAGGGDGHASERLQGLLEMIAAGRVAY